MNLPTQSDKPDYENIRKESLIFDRWVGSIPDDPYGLCPCGCGKKYRYAEKEGIEIHYNNFKDQHISLNL